MVHNYDTTKGLYPGEEGYQEWTGWEEQFKIPGTTFKRYNPIHPLTFHSKLLKNHQLLHSRKKKGEAYTDYKIRCNGELERNNRYFQPKDWTFDKLLYNYDLLYHIKIKGTELDEELHLVLFLSEINFSIVLDWDSFNPGTKVSLKSFKLE